MREGREKEISVEDHKQEGTVIAEVKENKPIAEKKVKIIIQEQEGDENQGSVFVSVNGYAYLIKRGFPVEVPESVCNVLKDAVITKLYQNVDTGEEHYKDVPRFNFRIVKE